MQKKTIVITGGHHNSALVVARELEKKGCRVVWFGHRYAARGDTQNSAEYEEVTEAGIKFYELKAGKLNQPPHLDELLNIPLGFFRALWLLAKLHPSSVLSFGGYLGFATASAALCLGIPVYLHEQTIVAGRANMLVAKFARKIYLTWNSSLRSYPAKAVVVGLPLRPGILGATPRKFFENKRKTLLILGGKQGSHAINEIVFAALPELIKHYNVIHQTGTSTATGDYVRALLFKSPYYRRYGYITEDEIGKYFAAADLVISRSGAHTAYELGVLGKRSILIPFLATTGEEQLHQAELLSAAGIATMLPQAGLTAEKLLTAVEKSLAVPKPVPLSLPTNAATRLVADLMAELR